MLKMTIDELIHATGAELVAGSPKHTFEGCVIDSRKAQEGSLFVAFRGEKVDGNLYVAKALEAGAACAVVTEEPKEDALAYARKGGCAIVRAAHDDPEEFMLRLATAWRQKHPDWIVCGVTGSVGKTTTKDMCAAALSARWRVHKTEGNFNNLIGVPLTLFAAPDDAQALVVEMGMNHAGEIRRLAAAVRPTVAVITNVGTSHIGNLGSRENIARAKAEIVSGMRPSAETFAGISPCLVLNATDDFTPFIEKGFARPAGLEAVKVAGRENSCTANDVELGEEGRASFTLHMEGGYTRPVRLRIPGRHAVTDFCYAMAIADRLHVDREKAAAAIEGLEAYRMRLDVKVAASGVRVIDDTYNASPASMAEALDVLHSMKCEGRRICILGEMGELGAEAERLHGYVGAYVAAVRPDLFVTIGHDLAVAMVEGARTMGLSEDAIASFATVEDAAKAIVPVLEPKDLVLVKASRAEGLDAFVREVLA